MCSVFCDREIKRNVFELLIYGLEADLLMYSPPLPFLPYVDNRQRRHIRLQVLREHVTRLRPLVWHAMKFESRDHRENIIANRFPSIAHAALTHAEILYVSRSHKTCSLNQYTECRTPTTNDTLTMIQILLYFIGQNNKNNYSSHWHFVSNLAGKHDQQ